MCVINKPVKRFATVRVDIKNLQITDSHQNYCNYELLVWILYLHSIHFPENIRFRSVRFDIQWPNLDSDASYIWCWMRQWYELHNKTAVWKKFTVPYVKQTQTGSRQNDFCGPLSDFFFFLSRFLLLSPHLPRNQTASALRTISSTRILIYSQTHY